MNRITKNRQSETVLNQMVERFFAPDELAVFRELAEGYFNVAYEIKLKSGRETILKIAPPIGVPVMSYEKNIMFSEVQAMIMASAYTDIPVAKVYGYDNSRAICLSPYFFMEKLDGESLYALKDRLSKEEIHKIEMEVGSQIRRINEIVCPYFGFPGQPKLQGLKWYGVFKNMLSLGVEDAIRQNINLKISIDKIWKCLERDKRIFEEVNKPRLVHWDCCDENIIVKDGKVTGIIDWERCLWADPLMEVGFRSFKENTYFRKGYGIEAFTKSQELRILWYDLYLALLLSLEHEYRKYETTEMYDWATDILAGQFSKILQVESPVDDKEGRKNSDL